MHTLTFDLSKTFPLTSNLPSRRRPRPAPATRWPHRARCASPEQGGKVWDMLSEEVQALLQKEEKKHLFDNLDEAARRVGTATYELAEIERQQQEVALAKDNALEIQRKEAEIAESEKEILAAKSMLAEAQRSLSNLNRVSYFGEGDIGKDAVDSDLERPESVKAAAVSSIVGLLASLPISFYETGSTLQLIQHLAVVLVSSALFGVTFRYAVRRDVDNIQLKTGTVAAFGFVQGLATLEAAKPLELNTTSFISQLLDGAVYVSASAFVFIFSAVALDYCFKSELISPYPVRK